MKKYLVLTPFFPSDENHQGSYIYDQIIALKKNTDFDITVVKLNHSFVQSSKYTYKDIVCYNFSIYDFPSFILPGLFNRLNFSRFLSFLKTNNLDIEQFKTVHAHVSYPSVFIGGLLQKKYNIKLITQHHGLDVFHSKLGCLRYIPLSMRFYYNFCYKSKIVKFLNTSFLNVGVSSKVIEALKMSKKYTNKNNYVLYNGYDSSKFYDQKTSKGSDFIIGCIGNFWKSKDHITLIKSVHSLIKGGITNIKVKMIGSGNYLNFCKNYVRNNKLYSYFDFASEMPHENLLDFYNSISLFVLPSYDEALGCVYIESYACGTPFVAIESQGVEELLPDDIKNFYIAKKENTTSLAKKILGVYNKKSPVFNLNKDLNINSLIKDYVKKL